MFGVDREVMAEWSNDQLEDELVSLAGHINAAQARLASLVAEVDRRDAWGGVGVKSLGHWLMWKAGLSLGEAHGLARLAGRLDDLPATAERFATGSLSLAQAKAIGRVGTPANEATLLELAEHGNVAQLERVCRTYQQVRDAQQPDRDSARQRRRLSWSFDDADGSVRGSFRLAGDDGETFLTALRHARAGQPAPASGEPAVDPAHSWADALVRMAQRSLSADDATVRGSRVPTQVVVHVRPDGRAHYDSGGPVERIDLDRLLCDCTLVKLVVDDNGIPIAISPPTQGIPAATRRAVLARDGGCTFPACTERTFVEIHHLQWRSRGGGHATVNLGGACDRHHRLVHEAGYHTEMIDGHVEWYRPDGTPIPRATAARPPNRPIEDLPGHQHVDHTTAASRWDGTHPDLDITLHHLFAHDDDEQERDDEPRAGPDEKPGDDAAA